jgi:hypothetical protein
MALKDITSMGTCKHCGEWTKVYRYKGGYWCKDDIDFDKSKLVSKALNNLRNNYICEVRKAIR